MQTNAWSRREDEMNETDARAINYNEREITKKKAAIFRPRSFFKLVIISRSSETSVFPAIREIYASSKYTKTWPSDPPCPHFATLFTSRVRVGESQPIVIWLLFLCYYVRRVPTTYIHLIPSVTVQCSTAVIFTYVSYDFIIFIVFFIYACSLK